MKARVKSSGEIVEVEKSECYCATWCNKTQFFNECELDFDLNNQHPEVTISGWVARNASGKILFFKGKDAPHRPMFKTSPKQWHGSVSPDSGIPIIPQSAFLNLTWESDPIEVEIAIKTKKK